MTLWCNILRIRPCRILAATWLIGLAALAAKAERLDRFVILSDLHPHPGGFGLLEEMTGHVLELKPSFVVVLGDIASDELPGVSEKEIEAIKKAFNRLRAAGIEVIPVMGNHDVHPRVEAIKTRWFLSQDPLPLNSLLDADRKSEARDHFAAKGPYDYSFNRGGIHFVVVDSNCVPPGKEWEPQRAQNQARRYEAHLKWLREDLCAHRNNPERFPALVFLHHPEYMTGDRRMTERPLYNVLAGCREGHTVKAVFGGHWHYGQNFPAIATLNIDVYAVPASVLGTDRPAEFILAEVQPDRITFTPMDSAIGNWRTAEKPVQYRSIRLPVTTQPSELSPRHGNHASRPS